MHEDRCLEKVCESWHDAGSFVVGKSLNFGIYLHSVYMGNLKIYLGKELCLSENIWLTKAETVYVSYFSSYCKTYLI